MDNSRGDRNDYALIRSHTAAVNLWSSMLISRTSCTVDPDAGTCQTRRPRGEKSGLSPRRLETRNSQVARREAVQARGRASPRLSSACWRRWSQPGESHTQVRGVEGGAQAPLARSTRGALMATAMARLKSPQGARSTSVNLAVTSGDQKFNPGTSVSRLGWFTIAVLANRLHRAKGGS